MELNSKGLYDCSRKEKESCCLVFPSSTKREIRHFHVVVVQRRLRNVQKRLMHVWSCCFANINLLPFCRSRCPRCHRCLSSLLFYFHARRILWTGSTNWTSKITHQKAFIYVIDVSDTVKAIGVEMDSNSLTLTDHSPYIDHICYCYCFCHCSFSSLILKYCFKHSFLQKEIIALPITIKI